MAAPILIFGATGGMGSALARALARRQAVLFLSARNEEALGRLCDELGAPGAAADVLEEGALTRVVEQASAAEGLTGLAFCAGWVLLKDAGLLSAVR